MVLAVAQTGSLSLAAKRLGTDQSTVSRRLLHVEAQIGAKLFDRNRRGVTPTELGRLVAAGTERIDEGVRELQDSLLHAQAIAGKVRITMTEGLALHFVIPRILPEIERRYPDLEIHLITTDRRLDLDKHEADLALRFSVTESGDLVSRKLGEVRLAVLAASSQARRYGALPPEGLPWLTCAPSSGTPWLDRTMSRAPRFVFSSMEGVVTAVRKGLGVGIAAAALTQVYPDLVELTEASRRLPKLPLYLITRSSIRHSPKIDALWRLFMETLKPLVGK
ncbi:MAG: LysR family transcriptional regulator [Polyangiaceae bacterium]